MRMACSVTNRQEALAPGVAPVLIAPEHDGLEVTA
jgi:hypothetical protein